MSALDGKVALVTGAGSGIGEAVATLLAERGAAVMVVDVEEDKARNVAESLGGTGATVRSLTADVSDVAACERTVRETVQQLGGLHIAVNNAGISGPSLPTGEYPIDGWRQVLSVNLDGVFYGMRYQIPAMLDGGGGVIVNMSSILGSVGFANAPAYVAAKHGILGLTKTAAIEYAEQGIRVIAVGPGFIRTPLLDVAPPEVAAGVAQLHPNKRLGEPREVAELVAFLASDAASLMTGCYVPVDGGYLAQ